MRAGLRIVSVVALSVSASVLPVSGFAQTDSRAPAVLRRSSLAVVRPYVEARGPSHENTTLPDNLIVADIYRPVVEAMRVRSATFRRQCARIGGEPRLLVQIQSVPQRATGRSLAMTRIARGDRGGVRATVLIPISTRTPELIAHELEHVLEQLDGVDLQAKSRLPASGVRQCDCGDGITTFETRRAIATGQQVARELAPD